MTSNIGAKALTAAGAKLGFDADDKKAEADADAAYAQAKETVLAELRQTFRPEFLNRIDDIIVFRALTEQNIEEVARRMLKTVADRMETMDIHLDASDEAVKELAKEGFDPKYGARPLRRAIQSKVEDAVAEKMLDGTLRPAIPPSWLWRTTSWSSPSNGYTNKIKVPLPPSAQRGLLAHVGGRLDLFILFRYDKFVSALTTFGKEGKPYALYLQFRRL